MLTPRVLPASGILAEGDRADLQVVYNGPSDGSAVPYLPVYQDLRDAAQYNSKLVATATVGKLATAGLVVLGNDPNAGEFVGVILPPSAVSSNAQPNQASNGINKGDVIVVRFLGIAVVQVAVAAAGTAATVGAYAIGSKTTIPAAVGAPTIGNTIGQIVATTTFVTPGAIIVPVPGAGSTVALINVRIHAR